MNGDGKVSFRPFTGEVVCMCHIWQRQ